MPPQPSLDNIHQLCEEEPAISLRQVSKIFSRNEARADSLKESLLRKVEGQERRRQRDLIVALDEVSFDIARGEVLGLIGGNGSGKSTLLKLIAGIMSPTQGEVTVNGSVLGLIELGAGFHPDLNGEENIRLQGAIYGMTRGDVESRIEKILEFADLLDFRHMPVRHYSSGMFVRLGFAIAVHAVPDILLVDEVLAVGDEVFQERCLVEIRKLQARGTTLVFVTHFPDQAERICDRVIWLEQGRIKKSGEAAAVIAEYHAELIEREYKASEGLMTPTRVGLGLPGRFGSGEARIEQVRMMDMAGNPRTHFKRGEGFAVEIDYTAQPNVEAVDCTIPIDFHDGTTLSLWRAERDFGLSRPVGGQGQFRVVSNEPRLLPGRYTLTISISPPGRPSDHYDVLYKLHHLIIEPDPAWDTLTPIELKAEVLADNSNPMG